MNFPLNEKTLELNISAEILGICRRQDPRAFMFGTTLKQEGKQGYGYDSIVLGRLQQSWRTAAFQFKRALQRKPFSNVYVFQINNNVRHDQHLILYNMCGGKHLTALYVLPLYITLNDVRSAAPNLLNNTLFADAADIPPQWIDRTPHTLLVYPQRLQGIILSERKEIKLITIEYIAKSIAEKKIGISIEELRKNIKMGKIERWENASKRPRFTFQIFPSFSW
ncbi:hypothetical protein HRbin04_00667 [archaeon HR04]|jgi:hypothetical protein|nr:hypothetical protein HRbin04_00667 [archaeon HR04]